jgi:NTP pyrophosphatase (non-canonical NTP hydrolase)
MAEHQFQKRLQDALHRGHRKATEEEVAEVTAVVLTIVAELTGELALVIAELADRVEALEARA